MFSVMLPIPPSANNLFFNARQGRVKTDKYQAWQADAVKSIWAQLRADRRIGGPIKVVIKVPLKSRADIDNLIKPILDALVASQRIDDDRNVRAVSIERAAVDGALVSVWKAGT